MARASLDPPKCGWKTTPGGFRLYCVLAPGHEPPHRDFISARIFIDAQGAEITTTAGYSPEEQAAYCATYCIEGEHHPACAHRDLEDERP